MDRDAAPPHHIRVLAGTDVTALRRRYAAYEALHGSVRICAPMSEQDLDRVLDAVALEDGDRVVDVGCGHGELLLRAARCAAISGVGIDESPWAISRAAEAARGRAEAGDVEWWLGDARSATFPASSDVVACVGAVHIWHGFEGTLRALVRMVRPGGRVVIGDLRPTDGGRDVQLNVLERCRVEVIDEVVADRGGWDRYRREVEHSADSARLGRGAPMDDLAAVRDEWLAAEAADAERLEWAVWVGVVG